MTADLHNHTTLCNHATGTMREYVQKAIENKTKYFGFADHAPMEFDKQYRMSFSQMPQYENSVKELKNEYKNQIGRAHV